MNWTTCPDNVLLSGLFSLGPDKSYQNASASCSVLQLMQTIYLTPSPTNACFLSLPDICSFILFWSGLGRPSTHSCHSLGQAPTASFTDCPFSLHSTLRLNFFLFCHSGVSVSPGCSHSLLWHVTDGSRFYQWSGKVEVQIVHVLLCITIFFFLHCIALLKDDI